MRELSRDCPQMCIEPGIFALVFPSRSDLAGRRTGVLFRTEGLAGKQVELALQMISGVVKIGFLVNVASGIIIDRQELESACQTLGIKSVPAEVRTPNDLDVAFQALAWQCNRSCSGTN